MSTKNRTIFPLITLLLAAQIAWAGGPRFVAGKTYFDASRQGQAVVWPGGAASYFTDLGDLSISVSNATALATVATAAEVWNAVPTAAVSITRGGSLAENVSGTNVIVSINGVILPADIQSAATLTPIGIVFDSDGAVIDALFGTGASDPDDCIDSGAMSIVDNLTTSGSIAHALILINGRCTGTPAQLEQIEFQLIRAFGRVLGLGWSQANDAVLSPIGNPSFQQLEGWPVMRPLDLNCNQLSTQCVANPLLLRADDTAALSRLYPVAANNQTQFPGKQVTTASTISIHGSVYFRRGQGMQGVNVIARPITPGVQQPDDRYPVSAVTGFLYSGDHGNPITGTTDLSGKDLSNFGSDDPILEGYYDLSGIPLPPGESVADYQIILEPLNPLYSGSLLVGPYTDGTPAPSGTLPLATIRSLSAGSVVEQDFIVGDSAGDLQSGSGGSFAEPSILVSSGEWEGRIPSPGQTAWFGLSVLAGRHFTLEAQSVDDQGDPSEGKMLPVIGVWDASALENSPAARATFAPFNGAAPGITALGVDTVADGELLVAMADQRGDGRPDYIYQGRVLYAETVMPQRLAPAGEQIRIVGCGFRSGMTVSIGSQILAAVTSISPTLIRATAPPNASASGSLDLIVYDPLTNGTAVIAGGISYGAASGDTLSISSALPSTESLGGASPLTVRVLSADQVTPVAGIPVLFSVLEGNALFASCGGTSCSLITSSDGYATVEVTPESVGLVRIQASLTNGTSLSSEFTGVTSLVILPINSTFFIAPGAALSWTAQVQAYPNQSPVAGISIAWSGQSSLSAQSGSSLTNAQGVASFSFVIGPWVEGVSAPMVACVAGTSVCASMSAFTAHLGTASLVAVAGTDQQLETQMGPIPIVVRLVARNGQPIAGGQVRFWDSVRTWSPPCLRQADCAVGRLLSATSQSLTSDENGLATFLPNVPEGIPYLLTGQAEAGTAATLPFTVQSSP